MSKHSPIEDRVVSSFVSMNRYDKQLRIIGKYLLGFAVLFMIVLVGLSALFLLNNQKLISLLGVDLLYWPISRNERLLLLGGLSSAIVLVFCLALILMNAISRLSRTIKSNFSAKVTDPVRSFLVGIGRAVTQSRVWQYFVRLGTRLGFKYILYPALPYLEPTNDRKNISIFTYEELPPEAYTDEQLCNETLGRYSGSGSNIILWAMIAVLIISIGLFFLWAFLLSTLSIAASKLISWIADPISLFVLAASLCSPFLFVIYVYIFLSSLFKPFRKRQAAWLQCVYQIQRKKELEDQALLVNDEIGQRLQGSIEKLVELYKKEQEKTQESARKREDTISNWYHLSEQLGIEGQTLHSLFVFAAIVNEENDKKNKEQNKRDLIISNALSILFTFMISLFFFFLSVPAICK